MSLHRLAYDALKIEIEAAAYQRNGISGEEFWNIRFTFAGDDGGRIAARCVFFPDIPDVCACAIITEDMTQHWRGDHFEPTMRAFIASDEAKHMAWPSLYPMVAP